MPGRPAEAFRTTDHFGNDVVLYTDTWTGHILVAHPEMGSTTLADLRETIESPIEIRRSTVPVVAARSAVFRSKLIDGLGYQTNVVVRYADETFETGSTTGHVTTAYPKDGKYRSQIGATIYQAPLVKDE